MSQVIVTEDNLKVRRAESGTKEHAIDKEGSFKKWLLPDITHFDPVAAAIGVAVMPIIAIWYVIGIFVKIAIYFAISVSRLIGLFIGGK